MRGGRIACAIVALLPLLPAGCKLNHPGLPWGNLEYEESDYVLPESEVAGLRENFDAFQAERSTFYEGWRVYQEEVGLVE